ncbi:TOBE domain-containing protein [Seohaeicola zhoushanensis]
METVGIRAEDLAIAAAGDTSGIPARLVNVEELGSHRLGYFDVQGQPVVVNVPAGRPLETEAALGFAGGDLHLFDGAGRRIDQG